MSSNGTNVPLIHLEETPPPCLVVFPVAEEEDDDKERFKEQTAIRPPRGRAGRLAPRLVPVESGCQPLSRWFPHAGPHFTASHT